MNNVENRESVPEAANRLGLAGIEFVEYATSRPQALGQMLETMGFRPVAPHRSREVVLYLPFDLSTATAGLAEFVSFRMKVTLSAFDHYRESERAVHPELPVPC